jgi:rieske iron-sulfur protein
MARIGRRALLKSGIVAGCGLGFRCELSAAQVDPAAARPAAGDQLVRAADRAKNPLTPADVRIDAPPIVTWALDPKSGTVRSGSRLNQVLLMRLDPNTLSAATRSRGVEGIVAYTAICTHTGCEVDDWIREERLLHCACHGSKFDPTDGAKVVDGEAPRPLPALPLKVVRGRLVVAGAFTTRVGFEPA